MRTLIASIFVLIIACMSAQAQDALVVTSCGNAPTGSAYSNPGSVAPLTQDTNGRLCGSAGIGNAINIVSFGASPSAADNATAIQNAINAAVAQGKPLYVPAASSCYNFTAGLTFSGNLTIIGDYVAGNWSGGINAPLGSPALVGSVLCPSANGTNVLSSTATTPQLNMSNIGFLFQTTFGNSSTTTGDVVNITPTGTNQGLTSPQWNNVMIFGHDGSHYAVNLKNPIYGSFTNVYSVGGGAIKITTNAGNFGNMVWTDMVGQVVVGGSANGVDLSADSSQHLNLITFIRPQVNVNTTNSGTITPVGNPPTSSQLIWKEDTNVKRIVKVAPDLETNVNSSVQFGTMGQGNDWYPNGALANLGSGFVSLPAWGDLGPLYAPPTFQFQDTTSSGTVASTSMYTLTGQTINAASATTYTVAAELNIGKPTAGTNVTITGARSITANGEIFTSSDLGSSGGLFATGTTQINHTGSANTAINDNTSTGTITIGNATNTSKLTVANLASDTGQTATRTVCQDTTSNVIYFGSGTGGICKGTSSARFKHDIADLNAGLDQIMKLRPISYEYNAPYGDPKQTMFGFTAEQVFPILPKLVGTDKEGMPSSVDYVGMVPVLVKAVQEQQKQIAAMKTANDNRHCIWRLCWGG